MTAFGEKDFPFTEDQIQELVYDFMYECGIDPVKYNIPNFQEWLQKYDLFLKYSGK